MVVGGVVGTVVGGVANVVLVVEATVVVVPFLALVLGLVVVVA